MNHGDPVDDGDYDLIVGGLGSLRISENIGSPCQPGFALREPLLTINYMLTETWPDRTV